MSSWLLLILGFIGIGVFWWVLFGEKSQKELLGR